jgi:quinol monooxygenase YgiN
MTSPSLTTTLNNSEGLARRRQPRHVLAVSILRPSELACGRRRWRYPNGMTKSLYAEFTAIAGCEQRVTELLAELTQLVRAEPGNITFEPFTLESAPRRFFVFEVYESEAAFEAHITAPYGVTFNAALAPLIEGTGSELTWLNPLATTV